MALMFMGRWLGSTCSWAGINDTLYSKLQRSQGWKYHLRPCSHRARQTYGERHRTGLRPEEWRSREGKSTPPQSGGAVPFRARNQSFVRGRRYRDISGSSNYPGACSGVGPVNCCKQAIALRTRSMSVIAILQQVLGCVEFLA